MTGRRSRRWDARGLRCWPDGDGRSKDASTPRESCVRPCRLSARRQLRSRSGRDRIVRWGRPMSRRPRAVIPRSPCPTSDRSARFATTVQRRATSARWWRRRTTSSMPDTRARLVARHPANVVRLDLPAEELGDEPGRPLPARGPDARGVALRWDAAQGPAPVRLRLRADLSRPGHAIERTQRGFFARLRLEPFGPESGCCRTSGRSTGPKEDRYKLLRATGVNTSPVVVAVRRPGPAATAERLAAVAAGPPDVDVTDDDGVRHRLWAVPARGEGPASIVAGALLAAAAAGPITIADGHHRYETALRYRDERRMTRSCEEDPPFDYLLALFLEATRPAAHGPADPSARARHRRRRRGRAVLARAASCSTSNRSASPDELLQRCRFDERRGWRGRGAVRPVDAMGGALLVARRDRLRAATSRRAARRCGRSTSRCSASPWSSWPASMPRP